MGFDARKFKDLICSAVSESGWMNKYLMLVWLVLYFQFHFLFQMNCFEFLKSELSALLAYLINFFFSQQQIQQGHQAMGKGSSPSSQEKSHLDGLRFFPFSQGPH